MYSFTISTYGLQNASMTADINDSPLAHFTSLFTNISQVSHLFIEKKCLLFLQSLLHDNVHVVFYHRYDSSKKTMTHILALVSVLQCYPCDIITMGTYFLEPGLNQLDKFFYRDCLDQSQLLFSWAVAHLQSGSWLKSPSIRWQREKSLSADRFHSEEISQRCIFVSSSSVKYWTSIPETSHSSTVRQRAKLDMTFLGNVHLVVLQGL